jgi:hypothetical protein
VSNLRIYVLAQKVFTITDYLGYNSEVGNRTPGASLTIRYRLHGKSSTKSIPGRYSGWFLKLNESTKK